VENRQQGSNTLWLAIYNKKQQTQSTGVQIFVEFLDGKIKYGFYRHSDQSYLRGPIEALPENYSFNDMIKLFDENKQLIIIDEPRYLLEILIFSEGFPPFHRLIH